ncbi:hypothetical protein [Thermoactinospora rubra]|nr:hypothetical protein [Thermoactinospora rubra]
MDRAGELDGILDRAGVDDVTVDVTRLTVVEAAAAVLRRVGWT